MQRPEKNSYKEFDNEKKFLRLENSPSPPLTFLMVRPLVNDIAGDGSPGPVLIGEVSYKSYSPRKEIYLTRTTVRNIFSSHRGVKM